MLQPGEPGHGHRAIDAVSRVEREFAHQSHVGLFAEGTNFTSASNRVGSVDLRYVMPHNWTMSAQATTTHTQPNSGDPTGGPGYIFNLKKMDNHVMLQNYYTDRSPGMDAPLGYISRNGFSRANFSTGS